VSELPDGSVVVSGAARGVDRAAEVEAIKQGLEIDIKPPDILKYGKPVAFFMRNTEIVKASDSVVAFWDGYSTGTLDTLKKAKRKGIPITVYTEEGEEVDWE